MATTSKTLKKVSGQFTQRPEQPLTKVIATNQIDGYPSSLHVMQQRAPQTPCYLFSATRLKQQAQLFLKSFPGLVSYAVKANDHPMVLKTLIDAGINAFDVASINEIEQLHALCTKAKLHFNNPIKSAHAIKKSNQQFGVRSFAVDDLAGLECVVNNCDLSKQKIELTVRFTLQHESAAYDFGSKFGATPEEAVELLKRINALGQKASITFHPGSQCTDPSMYKKYIQTADRICQQANCTIDKLNIGGGFPARYSNFQTQSLQNYFKVIERTFQTTWMAQKKTRLLCEPGRAMVADSVSLLTKVIHRRSNGALYINDGIYGSFMEQTLVDIDFPIIAWREGQQLTENKQTTTLFGPTCDPTDRMADITISKDVTVGDYLEFGMMGAYCSATTTNFNGFEKPHFLQVNELSFQ